MSISRIITLVPLLVMFGLMSGCGGGGGPSTRFVSKPEPWRDREEDRCMALDVVRQSPFVVRRAALGGPGHCGASKPFEVSAALGGRVRMQPKALLRCEMIPAVDLWMGGSVQANARRYLGQPVTEIKVAASYACRPINHKSGAKLSEHGHANALDVSGFRLSDGRWIMVKSGWRGAARDRAFLRAVHRGACDTFTTVLGPNYDANHRDHFHLDLAKHGRDGRYRVCR